MNKKQLSDAAAYLSEQDEKLAEVIVKFSIEPTLRNDPWWELIDGIVSQQLSVKASATILGRLEKITPERPTPKDIINSEPDALRSVGLSRAKVLYAKDLAERIDSGELNLRELERLPDEDIIAKLTEVKGIGRWTAEMYLIFHLGRPDVLPVGDLGFREAARRIYGLEERPNGAELEELGERWRPYRSVATRYLWKSLENKS